MRTKRIFGELEQGLNRNEKWEILGQILVFAAVLLGIILLMQRLRMVGSTPASESAVSRKSTPSGGSSITFSRALADSSFIRSTW